MATTPEYDVQRVRAEVPALAEGLAHFDGPGGTQTPFAVGRAVADTLLSAVSNRGTVTPSERRAEEIVAACRSAIGDLVGTDPGGVIFGRSATALTYDLSRALASTWGAGDEVVVSRLDHDSNVRPWVQAVERAGATVRWADFDPATGEQGLEHFAAVIGERTRLVALTGASNLIGTIPPVRAVADLAHEVGGLVWVDGVHSSAHRLPDREGVGADFWSCSPYKFLGPHCGTVSADPALLETLRMDKLVPSSDAVPERFELGTLPYELMAGATAAVNFLADLVPAEGNRRERLRASYAALHDHESVLLARLDTGLREVPGVRVYSNAAERTPTLLFTIDGRDPQAIREHLAARGVAAPASHFYAIECSRRLGLGDGGGVRVGLAPYTDGSDVDRLLDGLREL
ncbi:cysteine desulfurase-like protein [Marihabitans asiaticum]|uniref:Cysteine desulfurase family protein (TIGR01976 family) n=1 Tax=Marihabitans asiaticum TaxID=415218 RepID=A0A560WEH3_9MICO|nr:cysteine desulfurase-like protein [Marihabitans asiaticum]TWD16043.1 cysteine desulfurase family protein (TIGR01976 family) [Marihabitans asiaticum]